LLVETAGGRIAEMTIEHVQERSRRLANALSSLGLKRSDRVAILLPQCPEALIAHLAAYRLGAIALPLFTLFGLEAIGTVSIIAAPKLSSRMQRELKS
jgi:acetyl-CoA synthetase